MHTIIKIDSKHFDLITFSHDFYNPKLMSLPNSSTTCFFFEKLDRSQFYFEKMLSFVRELWFMQRSVNLKLLENNTVVYVTRSQL